MKFSFRTRFFSVAVETLVAAGFRDFALSFDEQTAECTIVFEIDTCIRELYQWAAAAFACRLIESSRIERM